MTTQEQNSFLDLIDRFGQSAAACICDDLMRFQVAVRERTVLWANYQALKTVYTSHPDLDRVRNQVDVADNRIQKMQNELFRTILYAADILK